MSEIMPKNQSISPLQFKICQQLSGYECIMPQEVACHWDKMYSGHHAIQDMKYIASHQAKLAEFTWFAKGDIVYTVMFF